MNRFVIRKAVRRSLARIQYVTPVPPGAAGGLVAEVYAQAERDFGVLAPPVVLHSPSPQALAASWTLVRETLVGGAPAGRADRELVAAAVSAANSCPYCVTIHTSALYKLTGDKLTGDKLTGHGLAGGAADPSAGQLAQWARSSGQRPLTEPAGLPEGLAPARAAELAAVAVTFHYLNRMVTVFLEDSPLPPQVPAPVKTKLMHMTAAVMLSPAGLLPDGTATALLPEAPLPAEFSWAAAEPRVATALARAAAALDAAPAVPQAVRSLLSQELADWDGRPRGPGRFWTQAPLAWLSPEDRPAGRLALLTAFTPYQVLRSDITQFGGDDEALIQLTSWASMSAARTIASWLAEPART